MTATPRSPKVTSSPTLPPGSLSLRETLNFFVEPGFAQTRHQKYGPVFKTRLFGSPTIYMKGAEANRFVLSHENQYVAVNLPPSTKALLGPLSLSLQAGSEHANRRKLLAQAFMPRALSGYIVAMEAITQRYIQQWIHQETITWYPEIRNYTLDVACKLLVGLDQGSQTRLGEAFETWCAGLFSLPLPLPWTRFGRAKRCRHQLLQEIEMIIRRRSQAEDLGDDALGLLLQAEDEQGDRLSIEELKDQILLLLFAGHETLTSAIASFCRLVVQHPEVLAKLQREQETLGNPPLTLESLKRMSYLDQVLKEVLRFTPPVGGGFRTVLQTCEFNGYTLPQGWNIIYSITSTHEDETLYNYPDQFDPDRFSPERVSEQQKYGYVPYGGGIRECLGKEFARLEMKIFACHLLQHCNWQLLPDQDLTLETIPTPRPRDGLKVRIEKRG